jgi:2-hydroxychromene-2-carboxylate isomerase
MRVDFFFGIGSRYSYLAATRFPRVEAEAGGRVQVARSSART